MLSAKKVFMTWIHDEIENGEFSTAICYVKPVHSQVTCLGLLSHFLGERDGKGIFISVVRPHYYLQRLLVKERFPVDRLIMLDAVNRFGNGDEVPDIIRPTVFSQDLEAKVEAILEVHPDADFLILDNISALLSYMSIESLVALVRNLYQIASTRKGFQIVVLMDIDVDPTVVGGIDDVCDRKMVVSPNLFR